MNFVSLAITIMCLLQGILAWPSPLADPGPAVLFSDFGGPLSAGRRNTYRHLGYGASAADDVGIRYYGSRKHIW